MFILRRIKADLDQKYSSSGIESTVCTSVMLNYSLLLRRTAENIKDPLFRFFEREVSTAFAVL